MANAIVEIAENENAKRKMPGLSAPAGNDAMVDDQHPEARGSADPAPAQAVDLPSSPRGPGKKIPAEDRPDDPRAAVAGDEVEHVVDAPPADEGMVGEDSQPESTPNADMSIEALGLHEDGSRALTKATETSR